MRSRTAALAAAAALLFAAGASAEDKGAGTEAQKVKCEGVNACKGQSACHSAANGCAGKNACKGKGFLMMTPEECQHAKGTAKPTQDDEG